MSIGSRMNDTMSLFRNKRFMLNWMLQRNVSKFVKFLEYENSRSFFRFSIHATLFFPLLWRKALVMKWKTKEKTTYICFRIPKNIMANFEFFLWSIELSITSYFWRVIYVIKLALISWKKDQINQLFLSKCQCRK